MIARLSKLLQPSRDQPAARAPGALACDTALFFLLVYGTSSKGEAFMTSEAMIETTDLSKFYRGFAAIREVTFSVRGSSVTAFLGPNGAGKTTTMKILTGYLAPSRGTARIAGIDVQKERTGVAARIGYLPENGPLYPEMTPLSLLGFLGEARGLRSKTLRHRIATVVSQCGLERVLQKPVYKLSKGYRQRLGMAQALLHDPDILILDEPTSGLDPNQIREVRRLIRSLGESKTILLSTHILQEVEAVAEHVLVIHEGRIVFDGTLQSLRTAYGSVDAAFYHLTGSGPEGRATLQPEAVPILQGAGEAEAETTEEQA
jgi:ABC-2 type transport system ATP-binding protein